MAIGEKVPDRDLILSLMSGICHEYDSVVVLIASQHQTMSLEDAQFSFLMHEQRIEQLNTTSQLNVSGAAANFVSNTGNMDRRGKRNGCYKRFDRGFQGPTPNNQVHIAQQQYNPMTEIRIISLSFQLRKLKAYCVIKVVMFISMINL
ncbi:hypothetical protein ACOSP7_027323 [Xanthoceras sorbifolium]